MCGIVGYIGSRKASDIVIKGLQRLEYRGYDSAGISVFLEDKLKNFKKQGKVKDLQEHIKQISLDSTVAIGHTRWATHGPPSDSNAHPHFSGNQRLSIIHNGIIENYAAIKKDLAEKGHIFQSETDTEVLIHFIEDIQENLACPLEEAVRQALNQIIGAYAIVIMDQDNPDRVIAARKGSPLVVGIGESEYFLASDATPIIEYTNEVVYLNDMEMALITREQMIIKKIENNETQEPYIQKLEMELEAIEKGGFDHFMLKEIYEQNRSIYDCMRGRLDALSGKLTLGGIRNYQDNLVNAERIIIVACGTSWHAGLVAEYMFEEFARIPVEVEYASEFRYRNPVIKEGDVVIAISQSGETADTLAAMELAKSKGAIVLGVCNVVGSSIARVSHEGVYTHAGPEIGVASTKAFTAQLTVLGMIALKTAKHRGTISDVRYREMLVEMEQIPAKVKKCFELNEQIETISELFKDSRNFLYLGRGFNFPVALEGALKLKEISYIHAEGYPAAEMKHGPIALIDEEMPVVFIATRDSSYDKVVSNIQEVKARKGRVIAVVSKGDALIPKMADFVIEVPDTNEAFMPLVAVVPLQLLSYHIAVMRGCNVDQPRNLAKSVTVE
ncbi:MAG: glutamine--fructose-6-phosphate transaminase (isomerizing) [Cytophagales bacterium]|nr:glutamine--fructose-6-phosphate transaminase (isomerizing) [Cytophagales bacterium]